MGNADVSLGGRAGGGGRHRRRGVQSGSRTGRHGGRVERSGGEHPGPFGIRVFRIRQTLDAGASWRIVNQQDDGGAGWADLGFTTATDGVVVYGPADSDGNATGRPGQLFLTSDAGASWYQVRF